MKVRYDIDGAGAVPWMPFAKRKAELMAQQANMWRLPVLTRFFQIDAATSIYVVIEADRSAFVRIRSGSVEFSAWPFLQLPARRGGALLGSGPGYSDKWLRISSAGRSSTATFSSAIPTSGPSFWAGASPPVLTPDPFDGVQTFFNFGSGKRWPMSRLPGGSAAHIDISASGRELVGMVVGSSEFFTQAITGSWDSGYTVTDTGPLASGVVNAGFTPAGLQELRVAIEPAAPLSNAPFAVYAVMKGRRVDLTPWNPHLSGDSVSVTVTPLWADARAGVAVLQVQISVTTLTAPSDRHTRVFSDVYLIDAARATRVYGGEGPPFGSSGPLPDAPYPVVFVTHSTMTARPSPNGAAQFVAHPATGKHVGVVQTPSGTQFFGVGLRAAVLEYWGELGGPDVAADIAAENVNDYTFYLGDPRDVDIYGLALRTTLPALYLRA